MATIGGINCNSTRANTGFGGCSWEPGLIVGAIPVKKGYFVANSDIVDPEAWINALIHNNNPNLRGNPFPIFVGMEANGTEAPKESFGYGGSERSGIDFISWMMKWRKGKMCSYKSVLSYDGGADLNDYLFFDNKGRVLGWQRTVANVDRMYAFSMQDIYVKTFTPGTQSANIDYQVEFSFEDSEQLRSKLTAVETGLSYSDLVPIQTAHLRWASTAANGVYAVSLLECGNKNIGETYGTELADVNAWKAYNVLTGGAITITSVTYSAQTGLFTVNLDETDTPDYTTTANNIRLTLSTPSVLSGLGVEWYEGDNLILTGN